MKDQNQLGSKPKIKRKVLPGTDKDRRQNPPERIYIAIKLPGYKEWKIVSDSSGTPRVFPKRRVARNYVRNNLRGYAEFCCFVPAIAAPGRFRVR